MPLQLFLYVPYQHHLPSLKFSQVWPNHHQDLGASDENSTGQGAEEFTHAADVGGYAEVT